MKLAYATLAASLIATSAFAQAAQQPARPAAAAPPTAPAPAPPVLSPVVVYDLGRLIDQSEAGRDMRTKLTAIAEQINREIEPDQARLQAELNAIRSTPVGEAQSPAATQRQEAFQRSYAQFQEKQRRLTEVLQLTERNALQAFVQALTPALSATMVARNGLVALQAQSVEAFVPGVDITADLISRLNVSTRTINVERATLPAPAGQPAAAAQPAAPAAPSGPLPRQPGAPR